MSLLLNPNQHGLLPSQLPALSLTTALALCDAIHSVVDLDAQIKWPNDAYVRDQKVAGILLEAPRQDRLVMGVGVNIATSLPMALARFGATSLNVEAGRQVSREDLLIRFLCHLEERINQLASGDPQLTQDWNARSWLTGKRVTILQGDRQVVGECIGLATSGALRFLTEESIDPSPEEIFSGTVVAIHPASSG